MNKWRFSLILALIAGFFTFLFGVFQGARIETLLFRTIVSVLIFSSVGYMLGFFSERFFRQLLTMYKTKGVQVDVIADDNSDAAAPGTTSDFTPLTPENMKHIFQSKS